MVFALVVLPDGFYFLQTGWWVLHILAISFVLTMGYLWGSRRRDRGESRNTAQLPAAFGFLRPGWWLIHLIAIPFVFILGGIFWPR